MATTMKGPAAAAKARTRVAVQYREELPSRLQRAIDADSGVLPVDRLFGARDKGRRAVCSLLPELPGGKEGTAQQAVPMNAAPIPTSASMAAAARASANGMGADKWRRRTRRCSACRRRSSSGCSRRRSAGRSWR